MSQKLGQHFLKSKEKLRKIAESLDLQDNDTVIEIGPGHGELTKELRIKNSECRIVCIEKDKDLIEILKDKLSNDKNIKVVEGDALEKLPLLIKSPKLKIKNYKIVGNIPYYITGYLFRILSELENRPSVSVFTIQKEVAERICAHSSKMNPTHRKYSMCGMNLLAASVQFWAEPKIVGYVPKKYFRPVPKVDSAILELRIKNYELRIKDNYYKLIKIIFKQPRKTVLNNLTSGFTGLKKEEIIEKLLKVGVLPGFRPQNLKIEQLIELSTLF